MPEALQRVVLVRHSETAWTLTGQHTGYVSVQLQKLGETAPPSVPAGSA